MYTQTAWANISHPAQQPQIYPGTLPIAQSVAQTALEESSGTAATDSDLGWGMRNGWRGRRPRLRPRGRGSVFAVWGCKVAAHHGGDQGEDFGVEEKGEYGSCEGREWDFGDVEVEGTELDWVMTLTLEMIIYMSLWRGFVVEALEWFYSRVYTRRMGGRTPRAKVVLILRTRDNNA